MLPPHVGGAVDLHGAIVLAQESHVPCLLLSILPHLPEINPESRTLHTLNLDFQYLSAILVLRDFDLIYADMPRW